MHNSYQFKPISGKLGCLAPAIRQEALSKHLSDRITCFISEFNISNELKLLKGVVLLLLTFESSGTLSVLALLLFGTNIVGLSNELSRNNRDKNKGIVSSVGRSKDSFKNLTSIRNLMTITRMMSLILNNTRSMALMKPSAFNLAIAILINATMPILVKSTDIFWWLGCRISAMIGTGRDG